MFGPKDFEKINKKLCKAIDGDFDSIGLAFCDDNSPDGAMSAIDMQEFCRWWVRRYPEKFALLKGNLYRYRQKQAGVLRSTNVVVDQYASKVGNPFVIMQVQLLMNNYLEKINSTCQLAQLIARTCEKTLKDE